MGRSHAYAVTPPLHPSKGPRYPIHREGKRLLREAAARQDKGPTALGKLCKCSHSLIKQIFADGVIGETKPAWSSWVIPQLCEVLGVSLWDVVDLLTAHDRRLLRASALVMREAPERLPKFVADVEETSRDIAKSHGWRESQPAPEDDRVDGTTGLGAALKV
jgi:hypothetical protein